MAKLEPDSRKHLLAFMIVIIELESLSDEQLQSRFNELEFGIAKPLHQMTVAELENTLDELSGIAAPRYKKTIDKLLSKRMRVGEFLAEDDLGFAGTKMGSYPTKEAALQAYVAEHKGREPRHVLRLTEVPPAGHLAGWVVWERDKGK